MAIVYDFPVKTGPATPDPEDFGLAAFLLSGCPHVTASERTGWALEEAERHPGFAPVARAMESLASVTDARAEASR